MPSLLHFMRWGGNLKLVLCDGLPNPHSHSIVNPSEKLDYFGLRCTWLDSCCASSKVVHTVRITVK